MALPIPTRGGTTRSSSNNQKENLDGKDGADFGGNSDWRQGDYEAGSMDSPEAFFASLSFLVMRMQPLSGEPSADALGGNSGGSFHQSSPTLTEDTDLGLELVPVKLISQTLPPIGIPALPETAMPETQDTGVVLPGAIPVDWTFDGMDDDNQLEDSLML